MKECECVCVRERESEREREREKDLVAPSLSSVSPTRSSELEGGRQASGHHQASC